MEQQLLLGSKRIPSDWLLRRYEWLGPDGVPLAPDFALSNSAAQVADLAEWAYKNPASDGDTVDVEDTVEDELRVPLENSLFLRLSSALRSAHKRRKSAESSWAELLALANTKAQDRRKRTLLRSALRNKYVASLKSKLQVMSKQEALRSIVPGAGLSKLKKLSAYTKPSASKKPSTTSKPSLTEKPAAKKKVSKKHEVKKDADKKLAKVSKAKSSEAEPATAMQDSPVPLNTEVGRGSLA